MLHLDLHLVVGNAFIVLLGMIIVSILVGPLFCFGGTQADDAKVDTTTPIAEVLQVAAVPANVVHRWRDTRGVGTTYADVNSRAQSAHTNIGGRVTNVNNGEVTYGGYAPLTHTNTGGVLVVNGEVINGGIFTGGYIYQSYAEDWSSDEEYEHRSRRSLVRRNRRRGVRMTQSVRFS